MQGAQSERLVTRWPAEGGIGASVHAMAHLHWLQGWPPAAACCLMAAGKGRALQLVRARGEHRVPVAMPQGMSQHTYTPNEEP